MSKSFKINILVDIGDDEIVELADNLNQEEIEEELWEYIKDRLDWSYEQIN